MYRQFKVRLDKFKGSLFPDLISKWNSLDDEHKQIVELSEFKDKVVGKVRSNPLYYYGSRKANVIHSQLRMHCSNLKAHLVELHVSDDPLCICANDNEDNEHFLLNCPLYYTNRLKLMQIVSQFSHFNLDILLYGDDNLELEDNCKIFEAVQQYIIDSERFI